MGWLRVAAIAVTTLAASRVPPAPATVEVCAAQGVCAACARLDARVASVHIVAPLTVAAAVILFAHFPSLVLASRNRIRELWAAVAAVSVVYAALAGAALVASNFSRAWAYALSLHFALLLVATDTPPTTLFHPAAYAAVQALAVFALLTGAWYAGPPLPAWDVPGLSGCCGAVAHLAAWAAAETVGRAAVVWCDWWRAGGLM